MPGSIFRRGDILQLSWPHSDGGEKSRPVLVVSSAIFNADRADLILVRIGTTESEGAIPLAGGDRKGTGLARDGWIHPHDVHSIAQERVERKLGSLAADLLKRVDIQLREHLGL